jgi:hypothetical protein
MATFLEPYSRGVLGLFQFLPSIAHQLECAFYGSHLLDHALGATDEREAAQSKRFVGSAGPQRHARVFGSS